MVERRAQPRRSLFYALKIYDAETLQQIGELVDFNQEGLLLHGSQEMDTGRILTLRVPFPGEDGQSRNLDLEARCVWCRRDRRADCFAAGFKFVDPTPDERQVIQHALDRHARQPC